MSPAVKPIPDGYHEVTPYLYIDGASDAIEFYKTVLGAKERLRLAAPGGRVGHAELEIGSSVIMLADEAPDMGVRGPKTVGGTPVLLLVYVDDVDATFAKALKAGATQERGLEDQFYGDRTAQFFDPWGHSWSVATHIEDVPPDEMERRAAKFMEGGAG